MPCSRFNLNGVSGIVCLSRGRRRRCIGCGQPATFLCDWKVQSRHSNTCDAPLCAACAHEPAPDKHLCPAHAEEWKGRQR